MNRENKFSPGDSLLHCMMSIAKLDPAKRANLGGIFLIIMYSKLWMNLQTHLPKDLEDILTGLSPEKQSAIGELLAEQLK